MCSSLDLKLAVTARHAAVEGALQWWVAFRIAAGSEYYFQLL